MTTQSIPVTVMDGNSQDDMFFVADGRAFNDHLSGDGYADDTGVANAYVITLASEPTEYKKGARYRFKALNANTGASTLNVNNLGPIPIKKDITAELSAGDIKQDQIVSVSFDGFNFQMGSGVGGVGPYREHETALEKLKNKQPITIVCRGDSITWGYVPNVGTQTANPYPAVLQTLLREYYGYNEIYVINLGNSGKQSDEFASDTYVNEVLAQNPDLVIFMCGINDVKSSGTGGAVVPVDQYKENLKTMVEKTNKPFLFLTPTQYYDSDEAKNDKMSDYVLAMKNVGAKMGINVVDLNAIVKKDLKCRNVKWEDIALDGIHFIDSYYQRLAEFVFSFGLTYTDMIVSDDTFYHVKSPVFFFPNTKEYFTSAANPETVNFLIRGNDATKQEVWAYVFIDKKAMDFIIYNIPNTNSSNANKVNIDGVDYLVPSYINNPTSTFWNVKQNLLKLGYGLHKIKLIAVTMDAGHNNFLVNGIEFKTNTDEPKTNFGVLSGTKTLWQGNIAFKASTDWVISALEFMKLDKGKYNITFQASAQGNGFGLGSLEARSGATIKKFPLLVICRTSTMFSAYVYNVSTTAAATLDNPTYTLIATGLVAVGAGDNVMELDIQDNLINVKLNGSQCLALDGTMFPQKLVNDFWLYSNVIGSQVTLSKIEQVLG